MRPWILRALVMTAVYGVGQAAFVALRGAAPELSTLWTLIFLGLLLAVGVVWAGTEVILGRTPEEWSWFRAALVAAPSAGVLTWLLLIIFVDGSGVTDLGAALVGRASFTALLILGSTFVGTRLGWLSLSRRGEGEGDPMLDRDETDPDEIAAMSASGARGVGGPPPTATRERPAPRRRGRAGGTAADGTAPDRSSTGPAGDVTPEDDEVYRGDREPVATAAPARTSPDRSSSGAPTTAPLAGAPVDGPGPDAAPPEHPGTGLREEEPAVEPAAPTTDRTTRVAPPVVAVLPEPDPRFSPTGGGPGGASGSTVRPEPDGDGPADGSDGPSAAPGARRSVAEAARAARIARAQAQRDEKRGGDEKRRRGPRRRPGR